MQKYNILILTADAGFGHRRAAQALEAAFEDICGEQCQVRIGNPLHDPTIPDIVKMLETSYDTVVVEEPTLYKLAYSATDAPVVAQLLHRATTTVLNNTLTRWVKSFRPDAVLITHGAFTEAAISAAQKVGRRVPVDVIVTDLIDVHTMWFHQEADLTFVPTGHVYRQAFDNGLAKGRVRLSGLPVHPQFYKETRDRRTVREALGWDPEMTTVLVVGSARSRQTAAIAGLLDRSGLPLQIAVVAGGDPEAEERLRETEWHSRVHTYGLVRNMPELMHASDFIACKAGGLIVSESLACGLALILYEALPGQESGNVRYVVESGAGVWSPGPIGVLTAVYAWMSGGRSELDRHRAAARRVGKPRAAYDVVEAVLKQIE